MHDLVNFWNLEISRSGSPEIVESAFLRLYIEHEDFLRKTFIRFSLGSSYTTYIPQRKLFFSDESQLTDVIRGESPFVDYQKAIPRCSKHIFLKDPFDLIFSSQNFSDDLKKMKLIRNYLAHKSNEARGKYEDNVLRTYQIDTFIEPGVFLLRRANQKPYTYYTHYCNIFLQTFDALRNDTLLNAL